MSVRAFPAVSRRNFRLSVLNGAIVIGAMNSIASPDLVLTAFAAYLTANPLILGLISPLQGATYSLPQFWMVGRMQGARRVLPIYNHATVVRFVAWVLLAAMALLTSNAALLLLTLLAFSLVGGVAGGVAGLPFIEVIGKVIPPRQRGLVFGWRGALGGVLAVVGSQIVLFFTGPEARFDFPTNYGLLFVFGGMVLMVGMMAFSFVDEPEADISAEHPRPSFRVLGDIWRTDGNYRCYVRGQTLFVLAGMANGLVLVYANQKLGVRLELAGLYLLVSSMLRPVFSIAAGRLSVRLGNRLPVAAGIFAQAIGWALLLAAAPLGIQGRAAEYYLIPVYGLSAIQKGLVFSNLMALGLNVTPEKEHALYMGALNTWLGLVTLVTTLSGVIASTVGFDALFGLTLVLSCLSSWQFWSLHEHWEDEDAV